MFCEKCGSVLKDDDLFCPSCGAKQNGEEKEENLTRENSMPKASTDDVAVQNEIIKQIWPDWQLVEKIGEGSFGRVYRAKREEAGTGSFSAIKIICIPQNSSEIDSVKFEMGLDEQSTTAYFKELVDDCVNEIKLMESLKGTQNIVSVEDYKVIPHENEFGWSIYIRMELLTSFVAHTKDKPLTEKEVIKLGIDMCNALEFCAKLNVMHSDIKPENIFISQFGIYKLGDFGIARKLEKLTTGMSLKGTYNYMAPEVYNDKEHYDYKSDIYSLGIVLYKLLNGNHFPLVDPRNNNVTYQQMQDAFEKRMQGAVLPKPLYASDVLSSVILTACSFNPDDRFASASALKMALTNVQNETTDRIANQPPQKTISHNGTSGVINRKPPVANRTVTPPSNGGNAITEDYKKPHFESEKPKKPKKEKKKMSKGKKVLIIILAVVIVLAGTAGTLGVMYLTSNEKKIVRALDKESYDEALQIYKTNFNGDSSWLLETSIKDRLQKIKDDFASSAIEYEVANMEITTIEKMSIGAIAADVKSAKEYVSKLNTSRTAFNTAEAMIEKEDYAGAVENYRKVVEDDTNYESAKLKLATAIEKYRNVVLSEAGKFATDGSYSKAIAELESALKIVPDDVKLTEQLNIYKNDYAEQVKSDALKTASEYSKKSDYENSIKTIQSALTGNGNDVELNAALTEYSEKYTNDTVAKADLLTGKKNYTEAISLLESAAKLLPDNKTLSEKLETVKANQPISITTLTPINGGWDTWNEGTPIDPFGNTHTQISNYLILSGGHNGYAGKEYAEYRVYGKYKTISGSLISHADIAENGYSQVKIYSDDKLVYTSPNIERKTDMVNFEANIQGADYIKIEVVCDKGENGWSDYYQQCLILMNTQLWTE